MTFGLTRQTGACTETPGAWTVLPLSMTPTAGMTSCNGRYLRQRAHGRRYGRLSRADSSQQRAHIAGIMCPLARNDAMFTRRWWLVCQCCVVRWLGDGLRERAARLPGHGGAKQVQVAGAGAGAARWGQWMAGVGDGQGLCVVHDRRPQAGAAGGDGLASAARHQAVDSYLPDSHTVRESSLDDVYTCDLYVLILGHRYGFQPADDNPGGLSITQLEFRRAGECGIPRVALVRTSIPDVACPIWGIRRGLRCCWAFGRRLPARCVRRSSAICGV